MKSSFLINERISLRAAEPEDLDMMYEMENDPSMWDISSFTVPYSRHVLRKYIENSQCDVYSDKQLRLIVVRRADNCILGTIDLFDFVPLHLRAEVGIAIHRNYRKGGYATDALTLLCDYSFNFLAIHQLYAEIAASNEASLNLFASCGFVQCGLLKEWIASEGGYVDVITMQRIHSSLSD